MTESRMRWVAAVGAAIALAAWGWPAWREYARKQRVEQAEHDATFGTGEPVPVAAPVEPPVAPPPPPPPPREVALVNAPAATRRFSGTVEATNYSCYVDVICIVKVAGIDVITGMGRTTGPRLPWGSPQEVQVGETVEVYCRETAPNACTLEGDTAYFLRRKSP